MRRAAFFDIDGTLTRSSLMIDHFLKLLKNGLVDESVWRDDIKPRSDDYQKRYVDYDDYLDAVAKVYTGLLKGMKYDFIETLAGLSVKDNKDVVYTYTRRAIKKHLDDGDLVFFISGSPEFLVKHMAKAYGVTGYKGTYYMVDDDNKFTGSFEKMWDSSSKKMQLEKLQRQYDIDMQASFAYGDTNGDISMLEAVGHPVAINPIHRLLKYINDNKSLSDKIQIVVERKDVIYKLGRDVIDFEQGFTESLDF